MLAPTPDIIDGTAFAQKMPISLLCDEQQRKITYLVDRLAISLGNKHLGG
jgi:hypothetical protein